MEETIKAKKIINELFGSVVTDLAKFNQLATIGYEISFDYGNGYIIARNDNQAYLVYADKTCDYLQLYYHLILTNDTLHQLPTEFDEFLVRFFNYDFVSQKTSYDFGLMLHVANLALSRQAKNHDVFAYHNFDELKALRPVKHYLVWPFLKALISFKSTEFLTAIIKQSGAIKLYETQKSHSHELGYLKNHTLVQKLVKNYTGALEMQRALESLKDFKGRIIIGKEHFGFKYHGQCDYFDWFEADKMLNQIEEYRIRHINENF